MSLLQNVVLRQIFFPHEDYKLERGPSAWTEQFAFSVFPLKSSNLSRAAHLRSP